MRKIDARHKRVTVRWTGNDTRLQVLTSGLRYFEVEGGGPVAPGTRGARRRRPAITASWVRGATYEFRVRSRDRAGNWGAWRRSAVTP